MKISQFFLVLFYSSILLTGCSSDDNTEAPQEEDTNQLNPVISSMKETHLSEPNDPNGFVFKTVVITSVENNKKQHTISEFFKDDESMNVETKEEFAYNTEGLLSKMTLYHGQSPEIVEFFYDDQQQVAGYSRIRGENSSRFYRVVHTSSNSCFVEDVSLPYDDPNTEILQRKILEFDDNENVLRAGWDSNLDGVMDGDNNFQYDEINNLISGQINDEDSFSISYSSIIDTSKYLGEKTYGKKMLRILWAQLLIGNSAAIFKNLSLSYHLSVEEAQKHSFETLENGFYFKKTTESVEQQDFERMSTIEYTFE